MRAWMVCLLIITLTGCASVAGMLGGAVKGSTARFSEKHLKFNEQGELTESKTTETIVEGGKVPGNLAGDAEMPPVAAGPEGGTTGPMSFKGIEIGKYKPLLIMGGLAVVAGAVLCYFAGWGLGLMVACAGVALIALGTLFDTYPWVVLLPVCGVAVGGLLLLWQLRDQKGANKVLGVLLGAIEEAEPKSGPLKEAIGAKAKGKNLTSLVEDKVTKLKRKLGL